MGYAFETQKIGKTKITDEDDYSYTLNGINALQESADSMMGGLSYLLDIVGWEIASAQRTIIQDVVET